MRVLAIDPGNVQSAYLVLVDGVPEDFEILPNEKLLSELRSRVSITAHVLVIESMQSFGMAVGESVFDTQFWAGRFVQAWGGEWRRMYRKEVKMHLCHSMRAKDANIRQALIDKFGGEAEAIGGIKCRRCKGKGWFGAGRPVCAECDGAKWNCPPGPLQGIHDDIWSALALAITYQETQAAKV